MYTKSNISNFGKMVKNVISTSALIIFLLMPFYFFAQTPSENYQQEPIEQTKFDEASWQKIISEIDYSKDLRAEEKKAEEAETPSENTDVFNWRSPIQLGEGFGKLLSIALLSILGLIALVLLLRFLLLPPKNRKIALQEELEVSAEEIAENLELHDPRSLLEKAVDAENYRLAVRLYYLKIIRELSLKSQIQWQRDKTNHSYLQEMNGHALQDNFRAITLLFEQIWYGNREIDATDFKPIRAKAEQLLNRINAIV